MNTIRLETQEEVQQHVDALWLGIWAFTFFKCVRDHVDKGWIWYHVFPEPLLIRVCLYSTCLLPSCVQDYSASCLSFLAFQNSIHSSTHGSTAFQASWLKPTRNWILFFNFYSTIVKAQPHSHALFYVMLIHVCTASQTVSFCPSGICHGILHTDIVCFKRKKLKIRRKLYSDPSSAIYQLWNSSPTKTSYPPVLN